MDDSEMHAPDALLWLVEISNLSEGKLVEV